ncbi:MAG: hypothetical protein KatS3mg029_0077 [Saprospiraceae bacterium]|nr:MAG: hypothetical protein KatS3mg029_0077 [Saprospiraceae bacterium]
MCGFVCGAGLSKPSRTEALPALTFSFQNTRLRQALRELERSYDLHFSYSPDRVDLRQRISARAENAPLEQGLRTLLKHTGIGFRRVGNHIALYPDPANRPPEPQDNTSGPQQLPPPEQPTPVEPPPPEAAPEPRPVIEVPALERPSLPDEPLFSMQEPGRLLDRFSIEVNRLLRIQDEHSLLQVSLLPWLGTHGRRSHLTSVNASLNLLGGITGGVEGAEVGVLFNATRGHVRGMQVAGLGNVVAGQLQGTQLAAGFNFVGLRSVGLQMAGVLNLSGDNHATQVAGAANVVLGQNDAPQLAGMFNITLGHSAAAQLAGLANVAAGNARTQLALLTNRAKDVEKLQAAALYNRARQVRGVQLGLVNKADTVAGVSIGLLNLVRRGYNRFDLFASEALHFNAQLKLGAHRFYNVFTVGARYPEGGGHYTWGLGYGFGLVISQKERSELNVELLGIHLSDDEPFTRQLHGMGQLRLSWNHRIAPTIGFFFGPTFNLFASRKQEPDTGQPVSSKAVPYAWIESIRPDGTLLQAWMGVNAGFRF